MKTANIPLAKFTLNGVKFDLVFADMQTPHQIYREVEDHPDFKMASNYLIQEENVGIGNLKSAECINSYMSVIALKKCVENLMPQTEKLNMLIFSEVTLLVKMWAKRRGIYNYNLGYLNGISIMILVAKAMQ